MLLHYILILSLTSCLLAMIPSMGRPTNVTIYEEFNKCDNVNNQIESVSLYNVYGPVNITCNSTIFSSEQSRTYKVKLIDGTKTCMTVSGKRSWTDVADTLLLKFTGRVIKGYLKGSLCLNLQFFQGTEGDKCYYEPGITEERSIQDIFICTKNLPTLDPNFRSSYSSPAIQSVSCTGKVTAYYSPGKVYDKPYC